MEVGLAAVATYPVAGPPITRRDIGFHADDRFEPRLFRLFLELPRRVKVTVIGYGEGRPFVLQGSADEIVDPVGSVEKGAFCVVGGTVKKLPVIICDAASLPYRYFCRP